MPEPNQQKKTAHNDPKVIYVNADDRCWLGGGEKKGPALNPCAVLRALKESKGPIVGQAALVEAVGLVKGKKLTGSAARSAYRSLASWWPNCFVQGRRGVKNSTYRVAEGYRIEIVQQ